MTKVYERGIEKTWSEAGYIDTVVAYVESNPGKSIAEIAAAVVLNEEIVTWAVNTSHELLKKKGDIPASATEIWDLDISGYTGVKAGAYLKTLYDDWLNNGRLDLILDAILADVTVVEIENESVFVATVGAPITANAEYPFLEVLVSGGVVYVYRYNHTSSNVPAAPNETTGRTEITHFNGDSFELSKLFININKLTTGLWTKMGAADKAFIYAKYYDTTVSAFVLVPDIVRRNKAVDTLITAPPIQTDLGEGIVFDGAKLQLASRFILYFYNDANITSEVNIPFTFGVRRAR